MDQASVSTSPTPEGGIPSAPPPSPDPQFAYNLSIPPSFQFIEDHNPDFGEHTPHEEHEESTESKVAALGQILRCSRITQAGYHRTLQQCRKELESIKKAHPGLFYCTRRARQSARVTEIANSNCHNHGHFIKESNCEQFQLSNATSRPGEEYSNHGATYGYFISRLVIYPR